MRKTDLCYLNKSFTLSYIIRINIIHGFLDMLLILNISLCNYSKYIKRARPHYNK